MAQSGKTRKSMWTKHGTPERHLGFRVADDISRNHTNQNRLYSRAVEISLRVLSREVT